MGWSRVARRAVLVAALLGSALVGAAAAPPTVAGADPPPARLASGGGNHSCATTAGGELVCWGFNLYGQIDVPAGLGSPKAVDVGAFHTCAIGPDDQVSCWGASQGGSTSVPGDVGSAASISAGTYVTCAVRTDGTLRCWGSSGYSSEGVPPSDLGTVSSVSVGVEHTCAVTTGGVARCWGLNSRGRATVPGDLGPVASISAGSDHTCAVEVGGAVRCWGSNDSGQITVPEDLGAAQEVVAGGLQTCALTSVGAVRCWGDNWFGQSTPPAGTFRDLSGALYTHCAITTDDEVRCWGASISAGSAPATPSPAPPNGAVGTAYSHTLTSSRGVPAGAFTITSGSLPEGLTLSPAGVLSGTPEEAGTSTFTVGVDGGVFAPASATFSVDVRALEPPVNVTAPVIRGIVDRPRATRPLTVTSGVWDPADPTLAYRWLRSTDGSTWEPIPGATTSRYTPVLATDLGQLLRAEVTATNQDGSTTASVTTARTVGVAPGTAAAPKPPAEPTNVVARGFGIGGNMLVTWKAPFRNGANLTEMLVRVVPESGPAPEPTVLPPNATRTELTCATTSVTCTIELWGRNSAGDGDKATVEGTFLAPDPPTTQSVALDRTTLRQYQASFRTPTNQGGLPITGYFYDISVDGGPFGPLNPLTIVDPDVAAGTKALFPLPCPTGTIGCVYRYYAANAAGVSAPSKVTALRPFAAPSAPRISVTRTAVPGQLRVAITSVPNPGGLPVTGYRVRTIVDEVFAGEERDLEVSATEALISCPDVTTTCEVAVQAVNLIGPGFEARRTISYSSLALMVPAPPTVTPSSVDLPSASTLVSVQWRDPQLASSSQVRSFTYQLRACDDADACPVVTPSVTQLPDGRRSATVACPAGEGTCEVQVRTTSVNGGFSPWSSVTNAQRITPTAPRFVQASDLGGGVVEVTWQPGPEGPIGNEVVSWRVHGCDTSTGCDEDSDFYLVISSLDAEDTSVQDTCGGGVTCRYLVYGVTGGGVPGQIGFPAEVTTFDG
jgi:hypothetical protein